METLYDRTASLYDKRHENATTNRLRSIEKTILSRHCKGLVLDIGCGTGCYSGLFLDYIGLDISEKMIMQALEKGGKNYGIGDAESLPVKSNSIDTAICMFTVLNLCDYRKAAGEISRVLSPGGTAIVSTASVWDARDYSLLDKIKGKYSTDSKSIRIEKNRMQFKLFTKEELTSIFSREGLRMNSFHSVYRWQRPHWNRYVDFSAAEKIRLLLERILPASFGRIYIARFQKGSTR